MSDLGAWPHVYRAGSPGGRVLLMLHGTGGNEQEIIALATRLDPAATIISPRGRVSEQGMTRWFRRLGEGVFDVDDVQARADELAGFVTAALAEHALSSDRLIAVGFSNGANMALATAMRHPGLVSRVIAFSGMYPFGDREPSAALDNLDIALLNGHDDAMAPRASVDRLDAVLAAGGATVTRAERAGGHGITAEDLEAASTWLAVRGAA